MKRYTITRIFALAFALLGLYFMLGSVLDWPGASLALGAAFVAWGDATDCKADIDELRRRLL